MEEISILKMINNKLKEERESIGHFNVLIVGKTGVGKSTLINSIFGKKVSDTGIGKSVTRELREITCPDIPLRIYDTVGLELSLEQRLKVKKDIINIINDARRNDKDKLIHSIWYCINANSNRIEDEEIKFINELSEESGVDVVLILTQSYGQNSKELKEKIDNMGLNVRNSFCILAEDYEVNKECTVSAYGCDKLVEFICSIIPEETKKAFIALQKASIKVKHKRALEAVMATATAAFAEGFSPIPISDAAVLVPTQITMIALITTIYGVNIKKSMMTSIIISLLGTTSLTIAGRLIVSSLIKIIPGIGTGIGGMISGSTASTLTIALGKTYMIIMEKIFNGEISEEELEVKQFKKLFNENLKKQHENNKDYIHS